MKIYNMIKIDMGTGSVIDEDSFEYMGHVAKCKGGGSDSVDEVYNARMASIAEEQQGMAQEYYDWYKSGSGAYEQQLVSEGSREWVPASGQRGGKDEAGGNYTSGYWNETGPVYESVYNPDATGSSYRDMEQAQIASNMEMIPKETALQGAQIDAGMELLPYQTDYQKSQMELGTARDTAAMGLLPQQTAGKSAFYQDAINGVDVNQRADQAQADVAQAFSGTMDSANRELARMGVNPSSGAFAARKKSDSLAKAKAIGGARTTARTGAEQENFGRLQTAFGGV